MRSTRIAAILVGFGLALAGCSSATGTQSGGSGASTPAGGASATTGGTAPPCVVGTWRATGVKVTAKVGGVTTTGEGGGGFTVTIAPDGKTKIDFTGMQPVMFATQAAANIKGSYVFKGQVNGAVKVPTDGGTTGKWEPTGTIDWSTVKVTVDVTSPVQARIFDDVPLTNFTGTGTAQTGGAVDATPLLREGTFECSGDTLKIGPPTGKDTGFTWTLQRS
jgi:hypothetical protein